MIAPEVRSGDAVPEEATPPRTATAALAKALEHGWDAHLTYARGYEADASWEAKQATRKEPVVGEDGRAELTPKGKPRVRHVPTGPLLTESWALRARRGPVRLAGIWVDGSFFTCFRVCQDTLDRINSTQMGSLLVADPEESS